MMARPTAASITHCRAGFFARSHVEWAKLSSPLRKDLETVGPQPISLTQLGRSTDSELGTVTYAYTWTSGRIHQVFERRLYRQLIASNAFQRLADIRFLGAIDYFIHPTGRQLNRRRHTRLEHTLGVAHLALLYSQLASLCEREEKLVVSAALLHDIGHAPLSHSLEASLKDISGMDHHEAGARIILGNAPRGLGRTISQDLKHEGLDPPSVISLIDGRLSHSAHNFLFAHPINIDTLEAISRSETYLKATPISPTPDVVLKALPLPEYAPDMMDQFWRLKDQIYSILIQSALGLFADYVSTNYVKQHPAEFSEEDFFINERTLRRRHPQLFGQLRAARTNLRHNGNFNARNKVIVQKRLFFIDDAFPPGTPDRYRQVKVPSTITLSDLQDTARNQLERAPQELLFPDYKKISR